uniref:RING-type E3 ubiquitin transferase n=1 Tax=Davidia involucrata TaxID=16924 RepID=A0A5B7BQC1_DAVIN
MGDSSDLRQTLDDSAAVELTGKIMVVAIIVLFLVVVFVLFLHLYAKWFWYRRQQDAANGLPPRRRRRFDFAPGHIESAANTANRRGLDSSVLKSIPIVIFHSEEFKEGLECSVCLSDVSEGEKARLLPKCNHGFHVDCIDMWFQSHSTCPLCRNPVSLQSSSNSTDPQLSLAPVEDNTSAGGSSTESPIYPTNVLFWGNETQVSILGPCLEEDHQGPTSSEPPCSSPSSSSSTSNRPADGTVVVDIPRQMNEEEEPKSPVTTRLRSLKRLLSREKRVVPCSPSNVDVEQGRVQS